MPFTEIKCGGAEVPLARKGLSKWYLLLKTPHLEWSGRIFLRFMMPISMSSIRIVVALSAR
jgi:hypothetical protein